MKKTILTSLLFCLVNVMWGIVAFVLETFIPQRDYRLSKFVMQNTITEVLAVVVEAKEWLYSVMARWHLDPAY